MSSKWRIPGRLALLSPLALLWQPAIYAQEDVNPQHGSIEIGIRALAGDRSSSQFNEYRDLRPGLFIPQANLDLENIFGSNYFLNFQTRDSWQTDRRYLGVFGNYGKFTCEVRHDGTPHDFTNTAATLFTESGPGVFSIPSAVRSVLVASPGAVTQMVAGATRLNVSLQRKLTSGTCQFTPSAAWTFYTQYSHDAENGYRPLGTTLNDETNVLEQMEPVDYKTQDVKAGVEYAKGKVAFQAGYGASLFTDEYKALRWDNPFNATDAIGNGAHGQMALYPDNSAQSLNFAGAWNISKKVRLMASISPEWMRQNASFLPFTVNSAVVNVPGLPAASLNGRKTAIAANITLVSHPIPQLSLNAHYRDYDYINNTSSLFFSDYVYTDRQLDGLARQSLPYGFNLQTIGTSATWMLHAGESLTGGYDFVTMDRQHRDVAKSREQTASLTFDSNPKQWFSLRTSYQYSDRNPQSYVLNLELYPKGGNPPIPGGWEMFDEAKRIRHHANALLQVDASDRISFSASYDNMQDRYQDTIYGLRSYRSSESGTNMTYRLRSGISLSADYTYERFNSDQRDEQYSRTNISSNNDWESYIGDSIHTLAGGISIPRFHRSVTIDAFYSLSFAKDRINTRALGNPTLPGFLVTTAQDYPETGTRFHQMTGAVRYRLANNLFSKLEYRWERYDRTDFQIQNMAPYMAPFDSKMSTSLFLGADVPPYQVHIVSLSLNYSF